MMADPKISPVASQREGARERAEVAYAIAEAKGERPLVPLSAAVGPVGVGVGAGAGVMLPETLKPIPVQPASPEVLALDLGTLPILDGGLKVGGIGGLLTTLAVPAITGLAGWIVGQLGGEGGNGGGGQLAPGQLLGGGEAYDEGGMVWPGSTTTGTGFIGGGTPRAWDPIQQRYYQLTGGQAGAGRTLSPGAVLPGLGFITKGWVSGAYRRDGSMATTQMAMTSTGKMISLSEDGRMKTWRPYRSIVIGKTLTTSNVRRVSKRIKSHVKGLKSVLSVLK